MVTIGGNAGKDFPKPDAGQHIAVCCAVFDVGVQHSERFDKSTRKLAIVWELEAQTENGEPHVMIDVVPTSLFRTSKMREAASALLGRTLSEDEKFDSSEMVGKSAMLTVAEGDKGGVYLERRDALQDTSKGIDVTGSYGPDDEIHGLVVWHMTKAEARTVPPGQGVVPEDKGLAYAAAPPDYDEIPF